MTTNDTHRRPIELRADEPREECGVLGISLPHGDGIAEMAFFGLFALQHRGQEAAGIAVSDGQRARIHKDEGLVSNIFTPEVLSQNACSPVHRMIRVAIKTDTHSTYLAHLKIPKFSKKTFHVRAKVNKRNAFESGVWGGRKNESIF